MRLNDVIPVQMIRRGPPKTSTGGQARVVADILEMSARIASTPCFGFVAANQSIAFRGDVVASGKRNSDSAAKQSAALSLNATNIGLFLQLQRDRYRLRSRINSFLLPLSIIHSHDQLASGLVGKLSVPNILTIHSKGSVLEDVKLKVHPQIRGTYMERLFRKTERTGIAAADVVTFPSNGARDIFERDYPGILEKKDIRIVYNGIDWTRFAIPPKRRNREGMTLLSVCALTQEKRFERILYVVAELKRQGTDIRLLHAGSGPLAGQMHNLANELGIGREVVFLGSLNHGAVVELFRIADAYLLAGERVVFDLATLEAMASGLPVILSDEGGNREMVHDGENGFLCRGDDTRAFVERVRMLVSDAEKRVGLGCAARKTIQDRFTLDAMIRAYYALYLELVERHTSVGK